MSHAAYPWLVLRALYELVRYDVVHGALSVSPLTQPARRVRRSGRGGNGSGERTVCDAVLLACCLYWKPVLCLQRSICAMRVLRSHGVAARVVVGYRPAPFFSHAWVEVDGRVVNDSAVYQRRLTVLYTI
jgi:hypothetical protein